MSQSNSNSEPSMDEILASIRKIISEDQLEEEVAAAPEVSAVPVVAAAPEETKTADETIALEPAPESHIDEGSFVAPEPEGLPEQTVEEPLAANLGVPVALAEEETARVDVLADTEETVSFENDSAVDEIEQSSPQSFTDKALADEASVDEEFISSTTRYALDQAFKKIDEAPALAPVSPPGDGSIEAVFTRAVQEAFDPTLQGWVDSHGEEIVSRLSPLIREWMDENLPPLVEAAVTKEISRAVRSRRR